jgi:spore coat-associated protein N
MSAHVLSTKTKLLASAALLAAAAGAAGLGTFGSFTSTTSASEAVSAGTVTIGVGTAGSTDNRLTVAATGIVPGDTIQRVIKLSNSGTQGLSSVNLTTSATSSSALDTDATNGLQMTVDKCSTSWTESGSSPAYTYACSGGGTVTSVLASVPVIGSNTLNNLASLTAGSNDVLHVTLTFPSGAGNTLQGASSTINFAFTGTQRTASAH